MAWMPGSTPPTHRVRRPNDCPPLSEVAPPSALAAASPQAELPNLCGFAQRGRESGQHTRTLRILELCGACDEDGRTCSMASLGRVALSQSGEFATVLHRELLCIARGNPRRVLEGPRAEARELLSIAKGNPRRVLGGPRLSLSSMGSKVATRLCAAGKRRGPNPRTPTLGRPPSGAADCEPPGGEETLAAGTTVATAVTEPNAPAKPPCG
eukprot:CAMPEP_0176188506 /NCGR_PEP_ID=MMETSP0121_2-20121125/2950_1 /TAXON_ID=160619 /ORGANISM="Kryptoperidinium foliaceum, Strain CCMP 1326" /LENGTH=210 /DNA_ID=CAMNT_0017527083 /DNA_START=129 /DNA_END=758 /DNA_ORIENTATION=+